MGSSTCIIFIAVKQQNIVLPIKDWMKDDVWKLLENARDNQLKSSLFQLTGKGGRHFYDIIKVIDRFNLKALDFLDQDILEDGSGTTLQNIELISSIRSLTIVIDEFLNAVNTLDCLPIGHTTSKNRMRKAFDNSEIYHDVDLNSYEEEGLFMVLKSLLVVMTDALVNNKVFVYVKYTV